MNNYIKLGSKDLIKKESIVALRCLPSKQDLGITYPPRIVVDYEYGKTSNSIVLEFNSVEARDKEFDSINAQLI